MIDYKTILSELIAIPSVTNDIPQVNRAINYVQKLLEKNNILTKLETFDDGRTALYATNNTTIEAPTDLLINCHLDVVPATSHNDFIPRIEGDTIYGRGANDDKGNAVSAIMAILATQNTNATISIIFTTDEETGGSTTYGMVKRGYGKAKAAIILDSDEGPNIAIAQKGYIDLRLTATGKGGHSSTPWLMQNPIEKLTCALIKLTAAWQQKYPLNDHWQNTLALTMLSAGEVPNQIPDNANAICNIRFIETTTPDEIINFIREVTDLAVTPITICPCVHISPDSNEIKLLTETIQEEFYTETKIRPTPQFILLDGATDARHLQSLNIPIAICGIRGENMHSKNEWASLKSIPLFARIATKYAQALANR